MFKTKNMWNIYFLQLNSRLLLTKMPSKMIQELNTSYTIPATKHLRPLSESLNSITTAINMTKM